MRKIIAIGESSYDIIFRNNKPQDGFPGGRILNAAASLALTQIKTTFVSECGSDYLGKMIIDFLSKNGVDTNSVDRFTGGTTKASVIYEDGSVEYGKYPSDRFDVVWPRIDEDDIIIFGSLYSVENSLREALYEIIKYAHERKAIIMYIPGFQRNPNFRMTKIMTAMLENLDVSNIVLTNNSDIQNIFGEINSDKVYKEKIEFYCSNYIHINPEKDIILYHGKEKKSFSSKPNINEEITLGWRSGFIAGIVFGLINNNILYKDINTSPIEVWEKVIESGYMFANNAAGTPNTITPEFGLEMKKILDQNMESFN